MVHEKLSEGGTANVRLFKNAALADSNGVLVNKSNDQSPERHAAATERSGAEGSSSDTAGDLCPMSQLAAVILHEESMAGQTDDNINSAAIRPAPDSNATRSEPGENRPPHHRRKITVDDEMPPPVGVPVTAASL